MKYLFLIFVFAQLLLSQSDSLTRRTPEIELPDFVITKISQIDLPSQSKETPDLISPLSSEFILPKINFENITLEGLSDPYKFHAQIIDSLTTSKFYVQLGAGRYSLPSAKVFLFDDINKRHNYFIAADFNNTIDYFPNAKNYKLDLELGTSFILKKYRETPSRLSLYGKYQMYNYAPYISVVDNSHRTINSFSAFGIFENLFYKEFSLSFGSDLNIFNIDRENLTYLYLQPFGILKTEFEKFDLIVKAEPLIYKSYKDGSPMKLNVKANALFNIKKLGNSINLRAGVDFQSRDYKDDVFFSPFGKIDIGLSDMFIISFFYKNQISFVSPNDIWKENYYTSTKSFNSLFEKEKNHLGASTSFYLDRFINFYAEFSIYDVDNRHYFANSVSDGYFDVLTTNISVKEFKFISNFDLMKYGTLSSEILFNDSKIRDLSKITPYSPLITANIKYSQKFDFLLYLSVRFSYNSKIYTDTLNINEIKSRINLDLLLEYPLNNQFYIGLELNNLLNQDNLFWKNYNSKPFDILGYLKYKI